MIYGTALPAFTATYSGLVNSDTAANLTQPVTFATTANTGSPVGTYPITITGGASPNYSLSFNSGALLVARAILTITADDKSKVYGDPLPAFTATYKGLVNGDTPASLTQPIIFGTLADARRPAGLYQIRVSGGASPNYNLVLNNGVLTITKASLTITVNNSSKPYGSPLPTFTASYSGFVNGDTPASLTQPPTFATVATASSPVGIYPIVVSGPATANYTIRFVDGALTVVDSDPAPRCELIAANVVRDGALNIRVTAATGRKVQLEWSDDLQTWNVIGAKTSPNGQIGFEVTGLDGVPLRFFRAVSVSD
jgi:hypothetical protein